MPIKHLDGVFVHHFALVRENIEEVFRKMKTSRVGDNHIPPLVDLVAWKRDVWDRIPGPAWHYYRGCERVWEKTVEIDPAELPDAIRRKYCENLKPSGGI
jgi:hypothetical protein